MAATVFPPGVLFRAAVVVTGCSSIVCVGAVLRDMRRETTDPIQAWEWVMDKEASCMNDAQCAKAKAYREEFERDPRHFFPSRGSTARQHRTRPRSP